VRVLLDTQVWLWMQGAGARLGRRTRALADETSHELLLSAVSSWEIAIKFAINKLQLPEPPQQYIPDRMRRSGVSGLAIEHAHALQVAMLENHHRDPFDRMLIAQAQVERIPLLTADPVFLRYDVEVIDAHA